MWAKSGEGLKANLFMVGMFTSETLKKDDTKYTRRAGLLPFVLFYIVAS